MTAILVDIRVRTLEEFGAIVLHPVEEFTYVFSGLIEIPAGSKAPTILAPGMVLTFCMML